jgi:hypothetical protein
VSTGMRKEDDFIMLKNSDDYNLVRELRNILADFRNNIEKETGPFKHIGQIKDTPGRTVIK